MFKGNLYFVVRMGDVRKVFIGKRELALDSGFYTNRAGDDPTCLYGFNEESEAIAFGRHVFRGSPDEEIQLRQGARPAFALLHIGPITPAWFQTDDCLTTREVEVGDGKTVTQLVFTNEGLRRFNRIVENGSMGWSRVDMTMKIAAIRE